MLKPLRRSGAMLAQTCIACVACLCGQHGARGLSSSVGWVLVMEQCSQRLATLTCLLVPLIHTLILSAIRLPLPAVCVSRKLLTLYRLLSGKMWSAMYVMQVSRGYHAVLMDFGSARPMPIHVSSRAQALTVQEDAEVCSGHHSCHGYCLMVQAKPGHPWKPASRQGSCKSNLYARHSGN